MKYTNFDKISPRRKHDKISFACLWHLIQYTIFEFARISLHLMLDPVQPLEYETGLFRDDHARVRIKGSLTSVACLKF